MIESATVYDQSVCVWARTQVDPAGCSTVCTEASDLQSYSCVTTCDNTATKVCQTTCLTTNLNSTTCTSSCESGPSPVVCDTTGMISPTCVDDCTNPTNCICDCSYIGDGSTHCGPTISSGPYNNWVYETSDST